MFGWFKTKLVQFFSLREHDRQMKVMRDQKESGAFRGKNADHRGDFENDYNAATGMLKTRMDSRFPDGFHAKLGSSNNTAYDYGAARIDAVDRVSTAVAMALRDGATVRQAADAGAASVAI